MYIGWLVGWLVGCFLLLGRGCRLVGRLVGKTMSYCVICQSLSDLILGLFDDTYWLLVSESNDQQQMSYSNTH